MGVFLLKFRCRQLSSRWIAPRQEFKLHTSRPSTIIIKSFRWKSSGNREKHLLRARCQLPQTDPPVRLSGLPLANLEHMFYNWSWHGKGIHLLLFLRLSVLLHKVRIMALPLGLPTPTACTPLVSPKPGIIKRKCVFQPGQEDACLHGIFASRYLPLSEVPVFVPPLFL